MDVGNREWVLILASPDMNGCMYGGAALSLYRLLTATIVGGEHDTASLYPLHIPHHQESGLTFINYYQIIYFIPQSCNGRNPLDYFR